MEVQYRALVTVGNLHGVGFAVGKAANPAEAITESRRKAKFLPNLIYVEGYKQDSLCHDVMGKHNGIKCKIIGRRNKYSMIYSFYDALAKHRGLENIARGRGKRIYLLKEKWRVGFRSRAYNARDGDCGDFAYLAVREMA